MTTAIRYYSKTGNTKKLADAIGQAVETSAETVSLPITEPVDILFLGSSVYAAGVDGEIKRFIASLDNTKVKKVASFSSAALLPSTYKQVRQLLDEKGIPVDEREFHCRGSFKMRHKGKPNAEDLKEVQAFAGKILNSSKS